jgi:hypothetical protein
VKYELIEVKMLLLLVCGANVKLPDGKMTTGRIKKSRHKGLILCGGIVTGNPYRLLTSDVTQVMSRVENGMREWSARWKSGKGDTGFQKLRPYARSNFFYIFFLKKDFLRRIT